MEYSCGDFSFYFNDGTVEVCFDGKFDPIVKKELGFDCSEQDFIDWCGYYAESDELKTIVNS